MLLYLWIVHSRLSLRVSLMFICPVSSVSNVAVSLDCPFAIVPSGFSNVYLPCVFCVKCCCISGLSIRDCPFGFLYRLFVLFLLCQMLLYLWIVHSQLSLRVSLTFICPVSSVSNVAVSLDCPFAIVTSGFSNVYLSCVFCVKCCCISELSIYDYPFGFL